jgi:hypothetical protein
VNRIIPAKAAFPLTKSGGAPLQIGMWEIRRWSSSRCFFGERCKISVANRTSFHRLVPAGEPVPKLLAENGKKF